MMDYIKSKAKEQVVNSVAIIEDQNVNILKNDEFIMNLIDISDDTGSLIAMIITKDDKDLQKLLNNLKVNDVCLIRCRKSRNPEVVSVFAIKKINK